MIKEGFGVENELFTLWELHVALGLYETVAAVEAVVEAVWCCGVGVYRSRSIMAT